MVLRALGFDPSQEEIIKLIKEFDSKSDFEELTEESWKIDFQRFLEIIIFKLNEQDTVENIRKVGRPQSTPLANMPNQKSFKLFEDVHQRGEEKGEVVEYISKKSLMAVMRELDEEITEEEVEELIIRAKDKKALFRLGEIQNEDKNEKRNFQDKDNMVTLEEFIKVLTEDMEMNKLG